MPCGRRNGKFEEVMAVRKKARAGVCKAAQMRSGAQHPFGMLSGVTALGGGETEVYRQIRNAVPILDAAIGKLVRLTGGFDVCCANPAAERALRQFLKSVNVGRGQVGIESFLAAFLQSMLVYGRAVGEMVVGGNEIAAVLWGDVTKLYVQEGDSPLDFAFGQWQGGEVKIFPRQNLILFAAWNPDEENPYGTSVFRSMPFLVDVLLKIYSTIGTNWERAGNVRYSVVYKPGDASGQIDAQERSEQIAEQWSQAMQESRHGVVRDFVAVGDVQI
ncbi:MAG TPA: serine/threonine protein phosphatase, partial [Clostridiales bacterium]|nr:serine/threonine protein phosphatase [Clostridiales bacterium]